ncbi:hypothetical protein E8E11_004462 [Didymella keratinophila]|nr:hypothetical protein E8E11_004462 [Didymella keratinophila]
MGGLVMVTSKGGTWRLYGLTAGHILPDNVLSEGRDGDVSFQGYINMVEPDITELDRAKEFDDSDSESNNNIAWKDLGVLSANVYSQRTRNRDWALVDFNKVKPQAAGGGTRTYVTSTVSTTESVSLGYNSTLKGKISGDPVMVLLPTGDEFVFVHIIELEDTKAYLEGTSGTWVVKMADETCQVFGHVIAEDPLGDVYMVPIADVLEDIRLELNAQAVEVPHSGQIFNLEGSGNVNNKEK